MHEDGRGRVRLQGLRSCQVTSEAQALQLLFEVGARPAPLAQLAGPLLASARTPCACTRCSAAPHRAPAQGETNRVIGEHQLNRESSRSHSIFTITLRSAPAPGSEDYGSPEAASSAKLHLVDLAGSERVSKTKSDGQLLREAGHINKSLSILEQVGGAGMEGEGAGLPGCTGWLRQMAGQRANGAMAALRSKWLFLSGAASAAAGAAPADATHHAHR